MAERERGGEVRPSADQAVTELYAAHWSGLVRLAWLLLRDDLAAEEVVQDAFIAVHRHWDGLRDHQAAAAYLRRSVVNGARSGLRHRGVEERYLSREAGEPTAHARRTEASAEDRALQSEATSSMIAALGRLPQRQREVLTMRYYLDLSEAEIADALGISAGSVKAHAHRGLATLRDRMEATP
ncbi:RNA polymerase sigma-70 factor, sigma-E family [Pedococcus dokdonensis]|uniref:RNA polymerase sigma-70 factor, sigma-E family n=1 Tax=Pedococcus dokdonensis TaxID=443156 RepID=A0A1H0Q3Z1_9MICO|nr:SigE family RNA polymerase sigma factor [Pedococcus dokdonensis]SDP12054.1 RNA polymerase sigma-70 factor, sigma-E family [Pedococcus dokdonensis]